MDTAVLQTYRHIVEEGSFAAAARRMGISKSMSSKHIADLETSLGVRLLTRSTRSVKPTVLGLEYYNRVRQILDDLEAANEELRSSSERPSGRLRIGSPISYTLQVLNPLVMQFMEAFPEVQLDLVLDDGCADLIGEGFDALIRVGDLEDSSQIARRLHQLSALVVASPAYIAEFGMPAVPQDLTAHRCLYYSNMRGAGTWPFLDGNEIVHQKIRPVFSANNGDMIRAALLEGKGIAIMPHFMVEEDLAEGRLVEVLPDYAMPDLPVNLIYPSSRNMTAALRAFIDFIGKRKPAISAAA